MSDSVGSVSVSVVPDASGWAEKLRAQIRDAIVSVRVQLDDAEARGRLDELQGRLDRLHGGSARVDLDTAEANAKLDKLIAKEDDAARTRRGKVDVDTSGALSGLAGITSGLGLIPTLALTAGAALVPLAASLAGLAGAFGASALAAGGGLGAFGLSAVGNITSVLGAQKNLATQQAAVQSAAQSQSAALNSVANAEAGLSSAQSQQQAAQQSLTAARAQAQAQLRALADQITAAKLAEGDASISVREAKLNLERVLMTPTSSALDIAAARQQLRDAQFALHQARDTRKQTEVQAAKERKAGVAGNPQVIAARRALTAANAQVAQSQRAVAQAQAAAAQSAAALATAQGKLQKSQDALSRPGAQGFIKTLDKAKQAFDRFLAATSKATFNVADTALGIFSDNLPTVTRLSNVAAGAVDGLLQGLGKFLQSPDAQSFMRYFETFAPKAITQFGHIIGNVTLGIGHLLRAFAPLGLQIGRALENITGHFADFEPGKSKGFHDFLDYIHKVGPDVQDTIGALAKAFGHVVKALAPLGQPVLKIIKGIADVISAIPLPVLTALAGTMAGIVAVGKIGGFKVLGALGNVAAKGGSANPVSKVAQALGFGKGQPVYVTNWQEIRGGVGGGLGAAEAESKYLPFLAVLPELAVLLGAGIGVYLIAKHIAVPNIKNWVQSTFTGPNRPNGYGGDPRGTGGPHLPTVMPTHSGPGEYVFNPATKGYDWVATTANGALKAGTQVDALRHKLGLAEQDFDMVGNHAHQAFSGTSRDVGQLQSDLVRLTTIKPSVTVKDNALDVKRHLDTINAYKLSGKDLVIHARLAQQLDLAYGTGGGMGHPGSGAGSAGRVGPTFTGPVNVQAHDYHDFTSQLHRRSQMAQLTGVPQ